MKKLAKSKKENVQNVYYNMQIVAIFNCIAYDFWPHNKSLLSFLGRLGAGVGVVVKFLLGHHVNKRSKIHSNQTLLRISLLK